MDSIEKTSNYDPLKHIVHGQGSISLNPVDSNYVLNASQQL